MRAMIESNGARVERLAISLRKKRCLASGFNWAGDDQCLVQVRSHERECAHQEATRSCTHLVHASKGSNGASMKRVAILQHKEPRRASDCSSELCGRCSVFRFTDPHKHERAPIMKRTRKRSVVP